MAPTKMSQRKQISSTKPHHRLMVKPVTSKMLGCRRRRSGTGRPRLTMILRTIGQGRRGQVVATQPLSVPAADQGLNTPKGSAVGQSSLAARMTATAARVTFR